ncbi:MAG: pyridoxamine 5'-phosphate oxidase family protein [Actinomycetota bacterium]|nr:pyridoxamine 5'-phosphate oxidase family protein [Actinomycetota bacterium]
MSQREAIRMDDQAVEAFIAASARARVATLDKRGAPHVVPVSYTVLDGSIVFWADRGSQKVVNLRHDPRVACIIDDGGAFGELRGVEIRGRADLRDDPDTTSRVTDLFCAKVPEEWRESARATLTELAAERIVVAIKAEKVSSWDHSKVPGLRPQDAGR